MTKQQKIGSGFGAESTADDVLAGIDLTGRTVLVTGGYSGLGLETTRSLVGAGARVVVPARRPRTATEALEDIPRTEVLALDLSDLESVRTCAEDLAERLTAEGRTLDLIINNAGVMACPETRVGPGWELQFATNHLGHYALVNRLIPVLAPTARVVSVSSSGHFNSPVRWDDPDFRTGYDEWAAYGQSKTANALFALHLDTLGAGSGLHAYALHPGGILTPLQRHVPREKQVELGWLSADGVPNPDFKSPQQGAATSVWAATSPLLDEHGGAFLQDCDIADLSEDGDRRHGDVAPWAVDPEQAARLWDLSAELTGVNAFA